MAFKPSRDPRGMTKAQAEAMFAEPSRTTPKPDGRFTEPVGRLPQGYIYVWNRLDREYEKFYDHKPEIWEPHEFKVFPEDIGKWFESHSILTEDSIGKTAQRALAIKGGTGWLVPLEKFDPVERVDRSTSDNPEGWGTGGLKTKAQVVGVKGARPSDYPDYV